MTQKRIRFGEVYTSNFGGYFDVTNNFYQELRKKPRQFVSEFGNAYVFGKMFNSNEYKRLLSHGNDGAQTGFVDVTDLTDAQIEKLMDEISGDYDWSNAYPDYDWNHYDGIKKIREDVSDKVVFVGLTVGGDVGADLYVHYNDNKEIDSVIIENTCLFSEDEKGEVKEDTHY